MENCCFGTPVLPPRAPKGQNFKFLFFNVRPSKFYCILLLGPWFHINGKILVRDPRFAIPPPPPGPISSKFLNLVFNLGPSNFYCILVFVPWSHTSWQILDRAPFTTPPALKHKKYPSFPVPPPASLLPSLSPCNVLSFFSIINHI